jgi:SAM-dependent methyltransferase
MLIERFIDALLSIAEDDRPDLLELCDEDERLSLEAHENASVSQIRHSRVRAHRRSGVSRSAPSLRHRLTGRRLVATVPSTLGSTSPVRIRESGMPDETVWDGFFDPPTILERLGLTSETGSAADLGCGYGTFAVAAARLISGPVHAIDIDPAMVKATEARVKSAGLANVILHRRDFVAEGTGLPSGSVGYVMLFNILHAEEPERLLSESSRILVPGGLVAVMHWVSDRPTPRGPSIEIRPSPEACRRWIVGAGFRVEGGVVDLPPYHFGIVGRKA